MTADSAKATKFTESRRGFDPAEVISFQTEVGATLSILEAEMARLKAELSELRKGEEAVRRTYAAAVREKDEIVTEAALAAEDTIQAAQRHAESLVEGARVEAQSILEEALARASEAADEVAADKAKLAKQYNRVRTATNDLYRRLQAVAGNSLDDLAVLSGLVELEEGAADDLGEVGVPSTLEDVADAVQPDDGGAEPDKEPGPDRTTTRYERRLGGLKQRLRDARDT